MSSQLPFWSWRYQEHVISMLLIFQGELDLCCCFYEWRETWISHSLGKTELGGKWATTHNASWQHCTGNTICPAFFAFTHQLKSSESQKISKELGQSSFLGLLSLAPALPTPDEPSRHGRTREQQSMGPTGGGLQVKSRLKKKRVKSTPSPCAWKVI